MIVQDVEVQKKEELHLLGDVVYLVIGVDTDQDLGHHSGKDTCYEYLKFLHARQSQGHV